MARLSAKFQVAFYDIRFSWNWIDNRELDRMADFNSEGISDMLESPGHKCFDRHGDFDHCRRVRCWLKKVPGPCTCTIHCFPASVVQETLNGDTAFVYLQRLKYWTCLRAGLSGCMSLTVSWHQAQANDTYVIFTNVELLQIPIGQEYR